MSDTCAVCESELCFRWSDTHGVGVCSQCGLPYTIYHYENDVRVSAPPSVAVKESWLPFARAYWQANKRRVFPGAYSFMPHRGITYCGATEADMVAFDDWMCEHPELHPDKKPEPTP